MNLDSVKIVACILDMDGVVTDTAGLHGASWKRMFDEFLEGRAGREGEQLQPFALETDYRQYVDGKARNDGVRSFLGARHISLPYGSPDDPPDAETVCGLGNRKNAFFLDLLAAREVAPAPGTVSFLRSGRAASVRFALISASRNVDEVLAKAGLTGLFDVVVDGRSAEALDLAGKPAPDIFLEAARRLAVEPGQAAIIEDSLAGVRAGREGGFALVIGIGRAEQGEALRRAGADLVAGDLSELAFAAGGQPGPGHMLPSALDEEAAIGKRLQEGTPAIFLDYDGTLTPIVLDPARAELAEPVRQAVRKLAGHLFVAVISGRALADIRKMVAIPDLIYAGSHGFEGSYGSGYFRDEKEKEIYVAALDEAAAELAAFVRDLDGVRVEQKPFTVAVHYRGADERLEGPLAQKIDAIVARMPELKKTTGKKILELRPAVDWDKGLALRAMLERFHIDCSRVVPLYIGDDRTDEDAFRAIEASGIPILVGDGDWPTAARYRLRDPAEVGIFLERLATLTGRELARDGWTLTYQGFEPDQEKLREALCALGNGYFVSRGAAPEAAAGPVHYPGTYLAGCYNRRQSSIDGEIIENESLVNVPNWLPLAFRLEEGEWIDLQSCAHREYTQELDLAAGILTRSVCFVDDRQREIRLGEQRIVSMHAQHLACLATELRVENWHGIIHVRSALDGNVANAQVARYQELNNEHLEITDRGTGEAAGIFWLQAETNQSRIRISEACRTSFFLDGEPVAPPRDWVREPGYIGEEAAVAYPAGATLRIEKIVALFTSKDRAISESLDAARLEVTAAPDFAALLAAHRLAWRHLWQRCGIDLRVAGQRIPRILNLHIFHLLQTVSVHSIDLDVGIPPRGLHGEAYRGLIMWDELFVFPFLNLRIPDLTRALLRYRYRRLGEAKRAARQAGFAGAMFPWQSGSSGREEAQALHLNPRSGRWIPDHTRLQRHINIAVAYNVWLYYQVSGDLDFMSFYGAEMIIEIARFWASIARYNEALDRYEIKGVMGPDEFHAGYPGAAAPGLDNHAYTNVMAVWVLCRALDILELLPPQHRQPLWENLGLEESELEHWQEISRKMRLVFHDDGIISQFEGYAELEEFDWEGYRKKYGNIQRLDRILEAEGDSPDRYRISKQADVLMLFYLLSAEELAQLFARLGYPWVYETIPRNIDYYLKRTAHGSTLSRVVHAWVLARSRREQSWHLFCDALQSDVSDIQGGTSHEGIHLGAMAGTVDLVQRCYTGLETREDVLRFNPVLPAEVQEMAFNILYRHHWLRVTIRKESMSVASLDRIGAPIRVGLDDDLRELAAGATLEFALKG